ncbi:hypothetical protein BACIH_3727 [Bacillus amyloliquefaciens]|nr:hypothetical protein U471_37450 [Bacillus amyloliquefaciens CC178]AHZ17895.1 hypothetical protein V529_38690 [Bacillus velezensis SQR9]KYC88809.1 hypothetical protein B4140_3651 [Bacillus amyloliquefaciens]QEY89865.1 hypothetical protein BACIT_1966 [Bacillus amyloliquefaciens]QEY95404.1 hypothetical protein BACIH_3727 [Bacillus amyloliquefaciens]
MPFKPWQIVLAAVFVPFFKKTFERLSARLYNVFPACWNL